MFLHLALFRKIILVLVGIGVTLANPNDVIRFFLSLFNFFPGFLLFLFKKSYPIRKKFNVFLGPFARYSLVGESARELSGLATHLLLVHLLLVVLRVRTWGLFVIVVLI